MTEEVCIPSKPKRKSPRRALELRARIRELCLQGHTPVQMCEILKKTKQAIYPHIVNLVADGELRPDQTNYVKAGPLEERKWYKIIERTAEELPFYETQGLVPTARKMGYRLIELGVMVKKDFDGFYKRSAEARRGIESTYTKPTSLPKLPIDCFRDDLRQTVGDTAMWEPSEPEPDEPPDDPIEIVKDTIDECKDKILNYDGLCYEGEKGVVPGRWYRQPIYCEIWCESETIQPDLLKFQHGRHVKVAAMRGYFSTPFMYESCKRLKETAERYDWIEKIVILYFGDSDKAGNEIRKKIEAALKWYQGGSEDLELPVEVELRPIAITPAQVKKYKLTGFQLEAFMTTEARLKIFKQMVIDSIDDCFDLEIYDENCPDEDYDYEANREEQPEDIDVDNELYEDTDITLREKMVQMATDAFQPGWEKE